MNFLSNCRIYFSMLLKLLRKVEMTLTCEFNGMVLVMRVWKGWVYISHKRSQTLWNFFLILAVVFTDYLLLLVWPLDQKNVFNIFSIQLEWMLPIINISSWYSILLQWVLQSWIKVIECHTAQILQWISVILQKLVTLKPLSLNIEI